MTTMFSRIIEAADDVTAAYAAARLPGEPSPLDATTTVAVVPGLSGPVTKVEAAAIAAERPTPRGVCGAIPLRRGPGRSCTSRLMSLTVSEWDRDDPESLKSAVAAAVGGTAEHGGLHFWIISETWLDDSVTLLVEAVTFDVPATTDTAGGWLLYTHR